MGGAYYRVKNKGPLRVWFWETRKNSYEITEGIQKMAKEALADTTY